MKYILLVFYILNSIFSYSQELNCKVKVNVTTNSASTNPNTFVVLEKSIQDFLNNTKWTNENYTEKQKISCQMVINITSVVAQDVYQAEILVQSERIVFNTTYLSPIYRLRDAEVLFDYKENDPLIFNEIGFSNILTSNLSYFAYMIIGFDIESFNELGGQEMFVKAENVCNAVPLSLVLGGKPQSGWKLQEALGISGQKTKIGYVNNLLNSNYSNFRKAFYSYHYNGMDKMEKDITASKVNIQYALENISKLFKTNQNYFISTFILAKKDEIINIFKDDTQDTRLKIVNYLNSIEPTITEEVNKALKY